MSSRTQSVQCSLLVAFIGGVVAFAGPAWGQVVLSEKTKLLADDAGAGDEFGWATSISDGVVVIGARYDDDNGARSGSAYLHDAETGVQLLKLLPDDGAPNDEFGYTVDLQGNVVVVGARYDDDNGTDSGSAYLFNATTGAQIAKLLPDDGMAADHFGRTVAIDNGIVAVGAWENDENGIDSGAVYLFDAGTGAQLDKLLATDGQPGDAFGFSVAINNGVVAVGAFYDDDFGFNSGAAYLFDAASGAQLFKILPPDGDDDEWFGYSVTIDDGVLAVGARLDDGGNGSQSGSVYLYDVSTGVLMATLLADDGVSGDQLGIAVSIDGGIVAAGAWRDDDNGSDSGGVYLFDASTGDQMAKLLPDDGATNDSFGFTIGIDNGRVAVGAHTNDDDGADSGSAYVFATMPCLADIDGSGVLDVFDVFAFLTLFEIQHPAADFTGDGNLDIFDVFAFLDAFNAGCP